MKKKFIYLFIIFNFLFSNYIQAEAKEVVKVSDNQTSFMKKNWQPWAVTIITILVAATGILILAKNKGKKAD